VAPAVLFSYVVSWAAPVVGGLPVAVVGAPAGGCVLDAVLVLAWVVAGALADAEDRVWVAVDDVRVDAEDPHPVTAAVARTPRRTAPRRTFAG
jgi:hypothetical protein